MRPSEYYLPDIVKIAAADGRDSAVIEGDPDEVAGSTAAPSSRISSSPGSARRREQVMDEGATLIAPETVWFAYDTSSAAT